MTQLDLLLVNPATELAGRGTWNREPPVGLLYMASVLEQDGFSCQIVELTGEQRKFEEILDMIPIPRAIGFTCLTNTYNMALRLASLARTWYKAHDESIPITIMGGPHVTFTFRDVLKTGLVDFCLIGEVEEFISEFISLLANECNLDSIKKKLQTQNTSSFNVSYLDSTGSLINLRGSGGQLPDLDRLIPPARHLQPFNKPGLRYTTATVIVNRGCPNQCIFCSRQALFKKCRWRSPENVIAEIRLIHESGLYDYYNMYDNLTVSVPFMKKLLRAIIDSKDLALPWGAELRADMIDEESASMLQQANCKCIATGIESADDGILKIAGKFQYLKKIIEGLHLLKKHGITIQAYFVVGLPGETRETFLKTVAFIKNSPLIQGVDRIDFFAATPYPGSALFDRQDELGIDLLDHNFDHYDCQHVICKIPTLSVEELDAIWQEAKKIESMFNAGKL